MYQVKAFTRTSKENKRAASAAEALRLFREMQTGSGVTSCAVFRRVSSSASPSLSELPIASRTSAPDTLGQYGHAMRKAHNESL